MQRSAAIALAFCAGAVGLGGGYVLAQRSPAPRPVAAHPDDPDIFVAVQRAPGVPNAIAALATSKGGGPITPKSQASPLRATTVEFSLGLDADGAKRKANAQACAQAALDTAQAVFAGGPEPTGALTTASCSATGASTLSGRLRLATRPTTVLAGKPAQGAFSCEATLRVQVTGPPEDLRASAFGDTISLACADAGARAIAKMATKS